MNFFTKLFNLMLIFLVLIDITLITWALFVGVSSQAYTYIVYFDLIVCLILIPDFIYRLWKSDDKRKFIYKNWYDILGMIPIIIFGPSLSHASTFSRYLRLFGVIRIFALFENDLTLIYTFFRKTKLHYVIFTLFLIIISGSLVFYVLEVGVNKNVHTIFDALWYTLITITTVGFGDVTPVTIGGKSISVFIIASGVVFVGYLTAVLSSWFINKDRDYERFDKLENLITEMKTEIKDLKELIEKQNK